MLHYDNKQLWFYDNIHLGIIYDDLVEFYAIILFPVFNLNLKKKYIYIVKWHET